MDAAISGMKKWTAPEAGLSAMIGGFLQFVAAVCLVLALFGPATSFASHSPEGHEVVELDHTADALHEHIPCDDGVACQIAHGLTATATPAV